MLEYERISLEIPGHACGIYMAYPTSAVLKPTYRGHKTLVNHEHTKVGITISSFAARESEYMRTFGGEIAFFPLLIATPEQLPVIEMSILVKLRALFPLSGTAKEWFKTTERESIAEIVWSMSRAG